MLPHLIALFIVSQVPPPAAAQESTGKTQSAYNTIFTRTTGTNGYEEYVRACDLLQQRPLEPRYTAVFAPSGPVAYLQLRRDLVAAGQKVLDLVRAGNQKPVYDPRSTIDTSTVFPELVQFRPIARLFTAESYVRYAAGNPFGGLNSLLDGLTFSYKSSQNNLISALVGLASNAIVLSEASSRLSMMSEAEAQRVIAFLDELLAQPEPMIRAMEGERELAKASVELLLRDPKKFFGDQEIDLSDKEGQALLVEIAALGAARKEAILRTVSQQMDRGYQTILNELTLPASRWEKAESFADDEPEAPDLEGKLLQVVKPGYFQQAFLATGRRRAQLALFRLHATIIRFKWHNNRLPRNLAELEAPEYAKDPLTDEDMVYELKGDSYDLYSKGYKSTGRIHLKYQRQAGGSESNPYEPPAVSRG